MALDHSIGLMLIPGLSWRAIVVLGHQPKGATTTTTTILTFWLRTGFISNAPPLDHPTKALSHRLFLRLRRRPMRATDTGEKRIIKLSS